MNACDLNVWTYLITELCQEDMDDASRTHNAAMGWDRRLPPIDLS